MTETHITAVACTEEFIYEDGNKITVSHYGWNYIDREGKLMHQCTCSDGGKEVND